MNNVTSLTSKRASVARARAPAQTISRIHLLGKMRAVGPNGENLLPQPKKTRALLAYLCLAQGESVLRSRVAGVIWDRSGEEQARDNLRHALNELDQAGGSWRLERDRFTVRLDASACWIDAFESPDRSDVLLDDLHGISPAFDQWLVGERVRFENLWQNRLEQNLDDLVDQNAAPQLRAAAARKLLNFLPTHEPAVRKLMTAFVDLGDHAEAIREYERFRLMVNANLGVPPSDQTAALYEAIRLGARVRAPRSSPWPQAPAPASREVEPAAETAAPGLGPQPSIAVLPFQNLSPEAGHDYAAEGLVEDLVEAFSRMPSLFVVSRLSAAAFKQQDRTPLEIGHALGVRYVLSGSMRVVGDRMRLVVELTDANTGKALWLSRFDEKFSDLLDVQTRLAESVVRSVAPHLRSAEVKRVRIKRPEHHDAYDLFLRAQENMHSSSRAVFETAGPLFEEAIAHEPQYAAALAWLAYWHVMRIGQGWSADPRGDTAKAESLAQHASDCDGTEPMAFAVQGHVAAYLHKDFDLAFARFDTALQISPNCGRAWLWSAVAHAWLGEGGEAVEKINRAMALSPYDPLVYAYSGAASMAYLADHQYDRAIEFALRCKQENRVYTTAHKVLILALVLAGREGEARALVHQLLRLEPDFTVEQFRRRSPVSAGPLCDAYCTALVQAGVPLSA